ncbi:hypothetical protein BC829DRAFT_400151 [Chytridium lagenaria]|nr:hypothetical protein BC829DRAFT_400151 [Chytridium lagenaria]
MVVWLMMSLSLLTIPPVFCEKWSVSHSNSQKLSVIPLADVYREETVGFNSTAFFTLPFIFASIALGDYEQTDRK